MFMAAAADTTTSSTSSSVAATTTTTAPSSNNNSDSVRQQNEENENKYKKKKKIVYLIRHAESEENRRLASLVNAVKSLTRFTLPKYRDIGSALLLLNIPQNVDSNVSEYGKLQISHMSNILSQSKFCISSNIELIAYSPLLRAKETAVGMLQLHDDHDVDEDDNDDDRKQQQQDSQYRIHGELDLLLEKTPAEWIPGNLGSLYDRMSKLEHWIIEQPETNIVLVGHSQYFKAMLDLDYKFGNCDVMRVELLYNDDDVDDHENDDQKKQSTNNAEWVNLTAVHKCELPRGPPKCDDDGNDTTTPATTTSSSAGSCSPTNIDKNTS